jgi:hypothetical protein
MRRSIQSLLIAASIAAFACAPEARATITRCDETTELALRNAVIDNSAIFGVNCTITLTQGPFQIPPSSPFVSTIINGNGFAVTLSGENPQGVIIVPPGATLNLTGVTIANGRTASSTGAGISNAGSLQVTNCTFTGNTNAILNAGSL